ncbi:MAG: MFS transporter [Chloroflexota bacterium]
MITSTPKPRGIVAASPVYYGWVVWFVATIGVVATAPGQSFTVSQFIDFFIEDFNMSRTEVTALFSTGTFVGSLCLPFVGRLVDRYGNRKMSVIIAALFATVLILFSLVAGPFTLLLSFFGIRMLGQGSLGLVSNTVIVEWFKRLRGRVMSITLVSFAVFQSFYVPWLQRQLETTDWRTVWIMLGIGVACSTIPLTWLLMRNTPEEHGLLPDGDDVREQQPKTEEELAAIEAESWTLNEVIKNPTFWVFVFGRIISPAWGTGLILNMVSIFDELGHSAATAASNYALITIITAVMSIVFGVLVDRLRPGLVMMLQLAALIASMALATFMTTPFLLLLYALTFGIMMGGGGVFDGAVWVNLFGRAHQGAIRGFVSTALVTGTAIGPILFGLSFDLTGSYNTVLWVGIALSVLGIIGALVMPQPERVVHNPAQ